MTDQTSTGTAKQVAAAGRAIDGLEAQADIWADEINLVVAVKHLGAAARGLSDRMPKDVREGFINRLEAQVDALARQAYLEGFYRGGESRKDYDSANLPGGFFVVRHRNPEEPLRRSAVTAR
jgi:hypothetical protein